MFFVSQSLIFDRLLVCHVPEASNELEKIKTVMEMPKEVQLH